MKQEIIDKTIDYFNQKKNMDKFSQRNADDLCNDFKKIRKCYNGRSMLEQGLISYDDYKSLLFRHLQGAELVKEKAGLIKAFEEFEYKQLTKEDEINENKQARKQKEFSLNLETRKKQKEEAEAKKKKRDEEKAKLLGIKIEEKKEVENPNQNNSKTDYQLKESGRIIADFIIAKVG